MKQLNFYEKSVYGKDLIYPRKDISIPFHKLTGNLTANRTQLNGLKQLGFEIVINKANYEIEYL